MLKDYSPGQEFIEFLAVRKSSISPARNGKPYLSCILFDGEAEIPAKQWDYTSTEMPQENTVIKARVIMDQYQGQPQLIIQRWRQAEPGECDPAQFIPQCPHNTAIMWGDIGNYIDGIQDDGLRDLVARVFKDCGDYFRVCPGAVKHHHGYLGGLMEHTLGTIHKALSMAPKSASRDLLIAGALLHDIGKIQCYDWNGCTITMTDEGKLYGHIIIGVMVLQSYMAVDPPHLEPKIFNALIHLMASHHGKLEWGSPVEPMMIEAVILHQADLLDCQMWKIEHAEQEAGDKEWTDKIYGIGREFYKGARGHEIPANEGTL